MLSGLFAVSIGAGFGAALRWGLACLLNATFPTVPLGTLAANIIGGFGIGAALGVFNAMQPVASEWRLLIVTGFLGGLTTFSTFTSEVATLLQQQRLLIAAGAIALHVCGSLCCFFLGLRAAGAAMSCLR